MTDILGRMSLKNRRLNIRAEKARKEQMRKQAEFLGMRFDEDFYDDCIRKVREYHRKEVSQVIGEPVLIELSVAETFARLTKPERINLAAFANQLFRRIAA